MDVSLIISGVFVALVSASLSALFVLYIIGIAPSSSCPKTQRCEISAEQSPSSNLFTQHSPRSPPHSSSNVHLNVPSASPISTPLQFVAETNLPTSNGLLRVRAYRSITGAEPLAIMAGDVRGQSAVPVRVHDACLTSEALGSLKCDCAQQLKLALERIAKDGCGIVIYLPQEGRGIGLANKIAVYAEQEKGLDTVEANIALGFPSEMRTYEAAAFILRDLEVRSVALLSNNPHKFASLKALGIIIDARVPILVAPNEHSQRYLQIKRSKMGHDLTHLISHTDLG
jgi:GTP cyclohydrolase II